MSKAVVIGNGESRKNLDLNIFHSNILIGCNALHRDFIPDHLVCCDRRMAAEATENPNTKNTLIYVRPSWYHYFKKILKNKNVRLVPTLPYKGELKRDDPDHWGSGGFAILLASTLNVDKIEIIGFDLYPIDKSVNNVYKGTKNYAKIDSQPVDPQYWIYQIAQVFKHFPNKEFIVRNNCNWTIPDDWKKNNVSFVAL